MRLHPHVQIGPYRIVSMIGRGGMGEVYRARDTRLGRDVAIKTIAPDSAHDSVFRARLEREARAVAALNHPHICAIYDVGGEDSVGYVVFEYIGGETLAAKLRKGSLPLERALDYAIQIADALAAAHDAGVIHRDLKPGNIMIDAAGSVKLLDFGVAKVYDKPHRTDNDTTVTNVPVTAEDTITGTLNYMSPEQAEGKAVDQRTDIFSFGAVLYEMLTGRKAFDGGSSLSTLSAILRDEAKPLREFTTGAPDELQRIIDRCLRKDPKQRFQHAADLKFSLEEFKQRTPALVKHAPRINLRHGVLALALVAAVVVASALIARKFGSQDPAPVRVIHLTIPLPSGSSLDTRSASVAVSPDERLVAFAANDGTASRLYVRPLDSSEAKVLPGTEDAMNPFFSPTGEWLGFFANGKLRKVRVDGGSPVDLCDAQGGRGGTWGPDDTIIFNGSGGFQAGLMRVPASGGTSETISRPDPAKDEASHRWPVFLPGGRKVLFTIWTSPGLATSRLAVLDLATGNIRELSERGAYARFVQPGLLIFSRSEGLMMARFDPETLAIASPPVFTGRQVSGSAGSGAAHFDAGRFGLLVYAAGVNSSRSILVWIDRNGVEQPLHETPGFYQNPRLSPDGTRVLFAKLESGNFDVWTIDIARRTPIRITYDDSVEYYPIWSPDGKSVTYSSNRPGLLNLFSSPSYGTATAERITTAAYAQVPNAWTRDGTTLAFTQTESGTNFDIWLFDRSTGTSAPLLNTKFGELSPAFSPDGRWLAYCSNESGQFEVYVRPMKGAEKVRLSTSGGMEPLWAPSGNEVFYRSGNSIMSVTVRTGPPFNAGRPQTLFTGYNALPIGFTYDVAPDGRRFVMLKSVDDDSPPTSLQLILNGATRHQKEKSVR